MGYKLILEYDHFEEEAYKEQIGFTLLDLKKGQTFWKKVKLYDNKIGKYRKMKVRLTVKNIFGNDAYVERRV